MYVYCMYVCMNRTGSTCWFLWSKHICHMSLPSLSFSSYSFSPFLLPPSLPPSLPLQVPSRNDDLLTLLISCGCVSVENLPPPPPPPPSPPHRVSLLPHIKTPTSTATVHEYIHFLKKKKCSILTNYVSIHNLSRDFKNGFLTH